MYSYTVIQWLFIFYFYCFFGWCFESAYVSLKSRKLVNRGFMRGPFLPLYGSGAIMMLVVSMPFQDNIFMVYIAGCLGATVLEYVTGVTMEALFKVRYWDYSKNRFNFQGHICLGSSLAWGLLTILMTEVIHKPVESLMLAVPGTALIVITLLLTAYICVDFAISFKTALDLKDVLVKMECIREELLHIQKRLDVMIALTGEDLTNRKAEITENFQQKKDAFSESLGTWLEDTRKGIEGRLEGLKELVAAKPGEMPEGMKGELSDLKKEYIKKLNDSEYISGLKNFFQRDMIRSNPTMSSARFREALEELKKHAGEKHKK